MIVKLIIRSVSEYGITSIRVISEKGLIRREISEMNLSLVESINITQSILGRIFDYGTIFISGRGSKVIFSCVDSTLKIRKKIRYKR